MKLLHGSNSVIVRPDINKCHSKNDFGKGFYLTPSWKRAWEMERRRTDFYGGSVTVNAYELNRNSIKDSGLNVLHFDCFSIEWARFIIQNRDIPFFHHTYDIVIGPVADAVLDTVLFSYRKKYGQRYLEDEPLKEFISMVSQFGTSYTQYCFCTQKSIDILKRL